MTSQTLRDQFKEYKVCVLVPTYNNAQTLATVLESLLPYTDQLLVVNDGSTDGTPGILDRFPQIARVSYPVNKGKGYALRAGFQRAVELGYDYAITIDSDGQHFAEDLPKFLEKLQDYPNAIIMGARNMDQASVPGKSSFGHKFSNFWFKVETGRTLSDTQSGYRLYPVRRLQQMTFLTRKYEFEIEVLVRAAWAGIELTEVPVRVFYAEKEKRISHFRPFRDFSRISVLNTVLVLITFLYIKPRDLFRRIKKKNFRQVLREELFNPLESNRVKAISIGFGLFMGIVPLWGFQMLIAIAISVYYRLNKVLVMLASQVSIPPMIPIILYISHLTGGFWMGDRAEVISFSKGLSPDLFLNSSFNSVIQYVLGAVTLAVLTGVTGGLVTYVLLTINRRSKR